MEALKEWATVVKALEQGKQTVILRKGGILETASGFKIESKKFLLFPTWEHQETRHVKPEYQNFLNQTLNLKNFFYSQHGNTKKQNTLNLSFMIF